MNMPMPLPAGAPVPSPQELFEKQLAADIKEWQDLDAWIAQAKERETYLRMDIAKRCLSGKLEPAGHFPEGTSKDRVMIAGQVRTVVVKGKIYRKVLEELMDIVCDEAALTPEEKNELIKKKYELSITAFKKLEPERRAVVDKMLVITPGSIELEIK